MNNTENNRQIRARSYKGDISSMRSEEVLINAVIIIIKEKLKLP